MAMVTEFEPHLHRLDLAAGFLTMQSCRVCSITKCALVFGSLNCGQFVAHCCSVALSPIMGCNSKERVVMGDLYRPQLSDANRLECQMFLRMYVIVSVLRHLCRCSAVDGQAQVKLAQQVEPRVAGVVN